ncbi:hypothetical protein K9L97_00535 [Candidatus Woesearchaeota archaeon]|nr:hypothetical protein [Candidatus Woesearchaeota archaeon]
MKGESPYGIDHTIEGQNKYDLTINRLNEYDSHWRDYLEVTKHQEGVQIDVNGFKNNPQRNSPNLKGKYNASIIFKIFSIGSAEDKYEIYPIFNGKTLTELEFSNDVIGNLALEEALDIAYTTMSKDEQSYRKKIEVALYSDCAKQKALSLLGISEN